MAPVLAVEGPAAKVLLRLADQRGYVSKSANRIMFLAISHQGPAGIIRPGQVEHVALRVTSLTDVPHDPLDFTVSGYGDLNQSIDWGAFEAELRPAEVDPTAWHVVWSKYASAVGNTIGGLNARLADHASHLSRFEIYTSDVARLFATELRLADNAMANVQSITATDVALPASGLPLTFDRQFTTTITGRYEQGILGPGWLTSWDGKLTSDAQGNVIIGPPGRERTFTLQGSGGYVGLPGDDAQLTLNGGTYQLSEADGSIVAFRANGQLNFLQDSHGNRITAAYSENLISKLSHSNGDSLTFSYTSGRLTQIDDSMSRMVRYAYNAEGMLSSVTVLGGTTAYTYDSSSNAARRNCAVKRYESGWERDRLRLRFPRPHGSAPRSRWICGTALRVRCLRYRNDD